MIALDKQRVKKILYKIFRAVEVCAVIAAVVLFVLYSVKNNDTFIAYAGVLVVIVAAIELYFALRVYLERRVKKNGGHGKKHKNK